MQPSARFCSDCGAPLEAGDPRDERPAPPADDLAERRQVTVMFCDLVGSTALSTRLDPEDLRELQRTYRECCTALVERYDGYIARYMGDGILAYFGYPRAHEDDAVRAVHAALQIAARVPALGESMDVAAGDEPLRVRVGIASGPVVIGDLVGEGSAREHDVVGETPNLAARLQSLACDNHVVVSADTLRLLGAAFGVEDLGESRLKGFDQPVQAFRVTGVAGVESRFEASRGDTVTPFVGRTHEMNLVESCWRRVLQGDGQVILLIGEPGIGKSRITLMTRELVAANDAVTIRCQCSPYHQASALHPVVEHLARGAALVDDDSLDTRLAKLAHLLGSTEAPSDEDMALFATLLSIPYGNRYPPVDLAPEVLRDRTLDALQRAVESVAMRGSLFFLVEDIHWSDPSTLELIESLVDRVRDWHCLLMVTTRPEFDPPWQGDAHISAVRLNRLDRRQCETMIESLSGRPLPDEIVEQIAVKTDGVPLFVEELTRTIIDSGMVRAAGDAYVLVGPLQPLAIPTTLQDSLMSRLDRLDDAKAVAQLGAAIGREFPRALLTMVSDRSSAQVDAALARLMESGLLFRRGTGSRVHYVFKHALVRDAAYNSMLKSRRHHLHGRIARALLAHFPDMVETQPELVAGHYAQAGAHAQALAYWRKAADRAMARSACAEAIAHLGEGLACLERMGNDETTAEQAVVLRIRSAECMRVVERIDEAFVMLDDAQRIGEQYGLTASLAKTHHQRGNLYFPLARFDECLEAHRRSLEYANRSESVELEVQALGGLGDANYLVGRMRTAKDYFQRCVDLARENGSLHTVVSNLTMVGFARHFLLELRDALTDAEAAVELAMKFGDPRAEMMGWYLRGLSFYQLGEYANALDVLDRGAQVERRLGARRFQPQTLCISALCHEALGDNKKAMSLLEAAEFGSRRYGERFNLATVLGGIARVCADGRRRHDVLAEGERVLDGGAVSHNHMLFALNAIDACLRHDEFEHAEHFADRLESYDRIESLPWSRFIIERGRALARWGRGERGDSVRDELGRLRDVAVGCGFMSQARAVESALREA